MVNKVNEKIWSSYLETPSQDYKETGSVEPDASTSALQTCKANTSVNDPANLGSNTLGNLDAAVVNEESKQAIQTRPSVTPLAVPKTVEEDDIVFVDSVKGATFHH